MSTAGPEQLRRSFDLEHLQAASLTSWASVHRGWTRDGAQVVIKRTAGSGDRAHAMGDWTRALADAGVPVVTPSELTVPNPRPITGGDRTGERPDGVARPGEEKVVDAAQPREEPDGVANDGEKQPHGVAVDGGGRPESEARRDGGADDGEEPPDGGDEPEWWVAYPFVPGRPYSGSSADIEAAGDLLGRIHAVDLPPGLTTAMRPYAWPETQRDEVEADLRTLTGVLRRHGGDHAEEAIATVGALAERWWSAAFPQLRAEDEADPLPRAGVTSDYKASNLVFVEQSGQDPSDQEPGDQEPGDQKRNDRDLSQPVLVDPDNGGIEPRIFDLALAVVLFHNECPTAPGGLLTQAEWHLFAAAYARHVDLTDRERALWPLALDHMLWEEGTWVLEDNDDEAWADPRQGAHLLDLALATPDRYPLLRKC